MATAKVCLMAPSLVGSLIGGPQLQSSTSFGHSSKGKPDSLGKRTTWESPTARLGAGVYTPILAGATPFWGLAALAPEGIANPCTYDAEITSITASASFGGPRQCTFV